MVEYTPTRNEILVCLGIWAFGLLLYTIFVRITIPVLSGRLTHDRAYTFDRDVAAPRTGQYSQADAR
jgi:Ni/Fe-hydrogenase subunit HybB-like protein